MIQYSLGGEFVDPDVCDECEKRANVVADQLVASDRLINFLRNAYRIRDRYGTPPPCEFAVRVPGGDGVVHVAVTDEGATFEPRMSDAARKRLGLDSVPDQAALGAIVASELGLVDVLDPLALAQAARIMSTRATPSMAWSRFMAKLGLAFSREAYGDVWLDSPHAKILSQDLLGGGPPRLSQRCHHPPVEPVWPFKPPKHYVWIDMCDGVAVLTVALFGQLLGAIPVATEQPTQGAYSAWGFDPVGRTFYRSSFPAIWLGAAAARVTQIGADAVAVMHPESPFIFIPDGPDGPVELPISTVRADSPQHALEIVLASNPDGPLHDQLQDMMQGG